MSPLRTLRRSHTTSAGTVWLLDDTSLMLRRNLAGAWLLRSACPLQGAWLDQHGLYDAAFARRADALRTVAAYEATAPLPAPYYAEAWMAVQLYRLPDRTYRSCAHRKRVRRIGDGWIVTHDDGRLIGQVDTLTHARELIARTTMKLPSAEESDRLTRLT